MTDHLPECHTSMIPDFHNERWICICAALRACEERVLDAAREAVAALQIGVLTTGTLLLKREDALAAIDALRKDI